MSGVNPSPTIIIAGGGTGGHVLAGVAIADAWRVRYPDKGKILFVGARGGIEEKLVPRAGYPLETLTLGTLNRVSLARKLKTCLQLPLSLLKSMAILLSQRPAAVIGVGGYASGPLVLMARVLSALRLIPTRTAILEQNAVPGMTNRILGRVAHRIFCAFPGSHPGFAYERVVVTGNPVRASMLPLGSAVRDPFTIFVFGGSQGAKGINSLVLDALGPLSDILPRLRFIHQTGEQDYERVVARYRETGVDARVEKFVYDMVSAYSEASLVVCRAGSSTLSELAAVGRAAVLVPFPFASDNHQEKNARVFVGAGAAHLLVQGQAQGTDLAAIIRAATSDARVLEGMEKGIARFYKPDAARDIVAALMENPRP